MEHPRTPNVHSNKSKRAFSGLVRVWRRALHAYDPPTDGKAGATGSEANPTTTTPRAAGVVASSSEAPAKGAVDTGVAPELPPVCAEDVEDLVPTAAATLMGSRSPVHDNTNAAGGDADDFAEFDDDDLL